MMSLTGMLCCLWRCAAGRAGGRRSPAETADAEGPGDDPGDDLSVIRGIGMASQNRLNAAGIKTFDRLAQATPEEVRKILGKLARGAKVEDWIKQAADLASGG